MRILMVTAYPPYQDGIANYAVQEVRRLRAEGHDVQVLSPAPTAAHLHLDLRSRRGPLALARRVRAYDLVIIQYHPDVFYPKPLSNRDREITTLGLLAAFGSCRRLEVRVHEVNAAWGEEGGRHARMFRRLWRMPDRLTVHTDAERQSLIQSLGVPAGRIDVVPHGEHFERRTDLDRAGARRRLGRAETGVLFLCIGFIQPHKGFDRAIRAFAASGAARRGARLAVVGSVRVEDPHYRAHAEELQELADATEGVELHRGYVSDEQFDLWLVACDHVVLPYRHIWSSGVLERAALYDRPVIATRVGGLADQAPPGTVLVEGDDELASALAAAAGVEAASPAATRIPDWTGRDPAAVMAAVRSRAAEARRAEPARFAGLEQRAGSGLAAASADHRTTGSARTPERARRAQAALDELRSLPPITFPPVAGRGPLGAFAKRAVRRLTYWELQPVIDRVNHLQHLAAVATEDRQDGGSA